MNKLTINHAAFAPPTGGAAFAAAPSFRASRSRRVMSPAKQAGLRCHWAKDAAGHLVCVWTDADEAEPSTYPSMRRGGRGRASTALAWAA